MSISTLVLYVKRLSKNKQQNHIQYEHPALFFDKCDKYCTQLSNKTDHEKYLSNVENVTKTSSLQLKLGSIKQSLSKYYKKIYQTDNSDSLRFKSRDRNKNKESSIKFKLI